MPLSNGLSEAGIIGYEAFRDHRMRSSRQTPQDDQHVKALVEKLQTLPPDKLVEVEDFVDFLRVRDDDRRLVMAVSRLSEAAFAAVWDNPDDTAYEAL